MNQVLKFLLVEIGIEFYTSVTNILVVDKFAPTRLKYSSNSRLTTAIEADGLIDESPTLIFLDNIGSHYHDVTCTQLSCILTDPS